MIDGVSDLPPVAEALVQCVRTGLLVVAADDRVVTANQAFLDVFRAPAGTAVAGRTVADLAAAEPFAAAAALWAGRRGEPGKRHRCPLPGGRVVEGTWHRLAETIAPSGDPARTGGGEPGPRAATVTDLSAEAQVRRRLRQHNRALAELVATKTELVSALLHELRTPLAAARSMAELLSGPTGDPLVDEALRTVVRNLDRINDVTGEIATVSGIENGTVDIAQGVLDLPDLLREVAARAHVAADAEPGTGTGTVVGDRGRLAETFERLIAAVRAVSDDPAAVRLHATLRDGQWQVALPMAAQGAADRLFTATGAHSNATALMLARAVVGRHGGTVGVDSDAAGTPCLLVRLPAADRVPLAL
jgi:signal transduction histidine kinase